MKEYIDAVILVLWAWSIAYIVVLGTILYFAKEVKHER